MIIVINANLICVNYLVIVSKLGNCSMDLYILGFLVAISSQKLIAPHTSSHLDASPTSIISIPSPPASEATLLPDKWINFLARS